MEYTIYTATSKESFLERVIEKENEILYQKNRSPGHIQNLACTQEFLIAASKAIGRLGTENKTPIVISFLVDNPYKLISGNDIMPINKIYEWANKIEGSKEYVKKIIMQSVDYIDPKQFFKEFNPKDYLTYVRTQQQQKS